MDNLKNIGMMFCVFRDFISLRVNWGNGKGGRAETPDNDHKRKEGGGEEGMSKAFFPFGSIFKCLEHRVCFPPFTGK